MSYLGDGKYSNKLDDPIELLIKGEINSLPRWCKGEGDDFESHEWINTYGHANMLTPWKEIDHKKTVMFPYYICRHCHAVSNDFIKPHTSIKRVR